MVELEEMYLLLQSKSIDRSYFFGRALYVVTYEDFIEFKQYFKESTNILNTKENFRTDTYFKHIHAVKTNEYVEFHYDYGNPDKHFLLVLVHGIVDVLPYFFYIFFAGRKPYVIKESASVNHQ